MGRGVTLHKLYLDEQFGAINKDSEEVKNK